MPALIEREEISPAMQEALRRHVVRERERRKQEEKEAEKDFERRAKMEEERRRKEEEDSETLEQIKDQLSSLQGKLETLKEEKHQLFSQLKKVLHEEGKRKQKLKEQSEMSAGPHGHYSQPLSGYQMILPGGARYQPAHQLPVPFIPGHSALPGQSSSHLLSSMRHSMTQSIKQQSSPASHQPVKRPLSPASPQPGSLKMYQRGPVVSVGHAHLSTTPQHQKYEAVYGSHTGTGHFSPLSSMSNASANQQGIHNTPSRHMSAMHGGGSPSGRPSSQGSPYAMSLGKQLEHASQKSGFGDDSVGSLTPPRGRPTMRMMPQGSILSQQVPLNQLTQSPRVRSGSPGKYPMNPEKSHSPFHVTAASTFHQSRFYNK